MWLSVDPAWKIAGMAILHASDNLQGAGFFDVNLRGARFLRIDLRWAVLPVGPLSPNCYYKVSGAGDGWGRWPRSQTDTNVAGPSLVPGKWPGNLGAESQ